MSRKWSEVTHTVKSDTRVQGRGVNFDGLLSAEVLARRLAEQFLEETQVFVFRERDRSWNPPLPEEGVSVEGVEPRQIPSNPIAAGLLDRFVPTKIHTGSVRSDRVIKNKLVDMELPISMIRIALTTAYLDTSKKPLSVLFVADPGSGKSETISMFASAKGAAYFGGAVTAWGLYNELSEYQRRREKVSHILIDDLIPTFSRGKKIRDNFIATLLKLTEEGSTGAYSYDTKDIPKFEPKLNVGLISGVTRDYLFKKNKWGTGNGSVRKDYLTTGWMERNIPFSYSYGKDTLRGIFQMLKASSVMDAPVIKLNLPGKKFRVDLPEPYATEVQNAGRALGESIASNGIRYARDFMEIARAISLIRVLENGLDRNKIGVTEDDMKLFRSLVKYINLDFTELPHKEDKKRETEP